MAYNRYRKRHYNISESKRREYAKEMNHLEERMATEFSSWSLSSQKDSCYRDFGKITVRCSNHSADNKYHDIYKDDAVYFLVNIKCAKTDFPSVITYKVPKVLNFLKQLDFSKYRFINVVGDNVHCFYKGFKTKKDTFTI